MRIFTPKPLQEPSFFERLFKKKPLANVMIALNNLLAQNEADITRVGIDDIIALSDEYKTDLRHKFKEWRMSLFADYVRHCVADNRLEQAEIDQLAHLREILMLAPADVDAIMANEKTRVYAQHVKGAVSDGVLDDVEKEKLEKLKAHLQIPTDVAKEIYSKSAGRILQGFIDGAVANERISPSEERQMNDIARSLGIDPKIDSKSVAMLERYKLYWQIENGQLPEIVPTINIRKQETMHFSTFVQWMEERRVVKRRNYAGPTGRIKLAKGVYYRVGSLRINNITKDEWQRIDSGQLYLTNKRLIFMGAKGNKTIQINSILAIEPYSNGVDIQKERGKSPFLELSDNVDIFSMILTRLMDEQ